jgi:hypothetical protein
MVRSLEPVEDSLDPAGVLRRPLALLTLHRSAQHHSTTLAHATKFLIFTLLVFVEQRFKDTLNA